jgi:hypothetical protein
MTREERLVLCGKCKNRGFHPKQGVVCGLTQEAATFEDECIDYTVDERMLRAEIERKYEELEETMSDQTSGIGSFGIKNGILAGIILLVIGFGWLIGGLLINRIFFYPFILIVGGIISLAKGVNQQTQNKKIEQLNKLKEDILDS